MDTQLKANKLVTANKKERIPLVRNGDSMQPPMTNPIKRKQPEHDREHEQEHDNKHNHYLAIDDDEDEDETYSYIENQFQPRNRHGSSIKPKIHSDNSEFPMYPTSSSSFIPFIDHQTQKSNTNLPANTTFYNAYESSSVHPSSDPQFMPDKSMNFRIPSSPPLQQIDVMNGTLTNELTDFELENDKKTMKSASNNYIPSSPTSPIFSFSQSTLINEPISRNSSSLAEPLRKRQKRTLLLPENSNLFILRPQSSILQQQQQQSTAPHEQLALDRDGRVYGILLQDSTFPDGYSPKLYDDPTYFVVKNTTVASRRASELITSLFDRDPDERNIKYDLKLEDLGLSSLPEQIADFEDLVVYGTNGIIKPTLHVHASHNELRSITPKLFEITGLEVLTLRDNKIARVPGFIENLKSLKSLNLSNNKIKFLPHNILKMSSLQILRIRPNPLIEASSITVKSEIDPLKLQLHDDTPFKTGDGELRYVGKLHYIKKTATKLPVSAFALSRNLSTLQERSDSVMFSSFDSDSTSNGNPNEKSNWSPRLTELCLRSISQYLVSQSELIRWKSAAPERIFKLSIKALINGSNGDPCGYCNCIVIEPFAELMEFWDFKDAVSIPIKRRFCSRRCSTIWTDKIQLVLK